MTTIDQIQKHYDKLTAPERFALMIKAGARGDQAERRALADSAPKVAFEFPNVKGLSEGFEFLTTWHIIQQLGAIVTFYFMLLIDDDGGEVVDGHTLADVIQLCQRRFLEEAEAYRAVCKEYNVDPETLTGLYPSRLDIETAELIILAGTKDNPIELTDLQPTIEAYREAIERARVEWAEARAR
jgi:hypothetical protein